MASRTRSSRVKIRFSSNNFSPEVKIQVVKTMRDKKVEELTRLERRLDTLNQKIERNEPTYIKLLKEKEAAEGAYIDFKGRSYVNKLQAEESYHRVLSHLSPFEIDKLMAIELEKEILALNKLIRQYNRWLQQNPMEGGRRKTRRGTRRMRK